MTTKQQEQFNRMYHALKVISRGYMTPGKLRKECERGYGGGLDFEETLEMSYENIQQCAAIAVKNVKPLLNKDQGVQECDATEAK